MKHGRADDGVGMPPASGKPTCHPLYYGEPGQRRDHQTTGHQVGRGLL